MITYIEYLRDFNLLSIIIRLLLATILSGLIGMERSKNGQAAGLRTHILVCLGATIASMTGIFIHTQYNTGDIARIAAQVISGIGFIGSATVLVKNNSVITGLTTAACVWATGAIGIAIGYGFYEAAIIGTLLIWFITDKLSGIDKNVYRGTKPLCIYLEIINANLLNTTLTQIKSQNVRIEDVQLFPAKTNTENGIGLELSLQVKKEVNVDMFLETINNMDNVNFAILMN